MRGMLDSIGAAVSSFEADTGRCDYITDSVVLWTGYGQDKLQSISDWSRIVHPDDRLLFGAIAKPRPGGEREEAICRIVCADGTVRRLRFTVAHTQGRNGEKPHVCMLLVDVTELRSSAVSCGEGAPGPIADPTAGEDGQKAAERPDDERYRRMVELSPNPVLTFSQSRLTYANQAALDIIGAASLDELADIDPIRFVHPDDLDIIAWHRDKTLSGETGHAVVLRLMRLNGEVRDVSVVSFYDAPFDTVHLGLFEYTPNHLIELSLHANQEMNKRLVELTPDAILLHSDYRILFANPAAQALFGTEEDLRGRATEDLIHPDDRARAKTRMGDAYIDFRTNSLTEQRIVRADGTFTDVEVVTVPMPYRGRNAAVSVMRDITQRKQAEEIRLAADRIVRENRDRYIRLQHSLDHFSRDLFGVVNIPEMEARLIREVQDVTGAGEASLLEIRRDQSTVLRAGRRTPDRLPSQPYDWGMGLPLCRIAEMPGGYVLKLGEIRRAAYLLCLREVPGGLALEPVRIWLETICRYASVLYDNFLVIEDLTRELDGTAARETVPSRLLRLLFQLNEYERKRLSLELHDSALQEQIIWYRKLDQLLEEPSLTSDMRGRLATISQGLLDVIYQIRNTCVDLRPPMLHEEGLVASLESLFEFTQMRADYSIGFQTRNFDAELHEDQLLGIYRIVQELLANATKHSYATSVSISLSRVSEWIQLVYEDNGVGMNVEKTDDAFLRMGLRGMRERVRSLNGKIVFRSAPNAGLAVFIRIPLSY